jgi:YHS domain-containing protein
MSETSELLDRIDAEFRGAEAKIKQYQAEKVHEFEERQERLEQFVAVCDRLRDVWRPRLEALAQKFKDRVQVTPVISKSRRSATFRFASPLAHVDLTFAVMTDADVRHLVLDYTLSILPILMKFEKNRRLELPLDDVDPAVVEKWIDDRLVDAVRTYLELHQNANYLKRHLVSDPIAKVDFPRYAAAASLEWKGKTYYFIGAETRDEFARENKIPPEAH